MIYGDHQVNQNDEIKWSESRLSIWEMNQMEPNFVWAWKSVSKGVRLIKAIELTGS